MIRLDDTVEPKQVANPCGASDPSACYSCPTGYYVNKQDYKCHKSYIAVPNDMVPLHRRSVSLYRRAKLTQAPAPESHKENNNDQNSR